MVGMYTNHETVCELQTGDSRTTYGAEHPDMTMISIKCTSGVRSYIVLLPTWMIDHERTIFNVLVDESPYRSPAL